LSHPRQRPSLLLQPISTRQGILNSLQSAQHLLEMFRRTLPEGFSRRLLDRLVNRLIKIITEIRKLDPSQK
jgi:hypothetical protein